MIEHTIDKLISVYAEVRGVSGTVEPSQLKFVNVRDMLNGEFTLVL